MKMNTERSSKHLSCIYNIFQCLECLLKDYPTASTKLLQAIKKVLITRFQVQSEANKRFPGMTKEISCLATLL